MKMTTNQKSQKEGDYVLRSCKRCGTDKLQFIEAGYRPGDVDYCDNCKAYTAQYKAPAPSMETRNEIELITGLMHKGFCELDSHVKSMFGEMPRHFVVAGTRDESCAVAIFDDGRFAVAPGQDRVATTIINILNNLTPGQRIKWSDFND